MFYTFVMPLAAASNEQSSGLEETAASIAEAASMTKSNADYAHQANATRSSSNRKFPQLTQAMDRIPSIISEINKPTTQTASIIKTIDEIAFPTNLLALNAAGDAGKGFAVVAEKARNLARRSAEAAKHTTELLESSRKSAEAGVEDNLNRQASELSEIVDLLKSFVGTGRNGHSEPQALKSPVVAPTVKVVTKTAPAIRKKDKDF